MTVQVKNVTSDTYSSQFNLEFFWFVSRTSNLYENTNSRVIGGSVKEKFHRKFCERKVFR